MGASENVFLSPFSVAAVLSMVHAGAKGNTAKQLKSGLHLTNLTDEKINGVIGNLVRSIKVIMKQNIYIILFLIQLKHILIMINYMF